MSITLLTLEIRLEPDVVSARQRARQVAALLGFPSLDQTRIATAVSEIARNAFQYAGGGRVEFQVASGPPAGLLIRILERGPGIKDLQAILDGEYASSTGLGLGLSGARRLMDRFQIEPNPGGGTLVSMAKDLPKTAPFTTQDIQRVSGELAKNRPQGLLEEFQQQNRELVRALHELRDQQSEIAELHRREMEETNRGVVALYAELDEHANSLRRISELKSRFLSNMSHEFRSPLNTILSLTAFLLERSDGDLTSEQERQVTYIRKAAEGLSVLINDLLDLAKVEAGKATVRPASFEVADLFDNLRGSLRPLLIQPSVTLAFEEPTGIPALFQDEGKLGQILQNFLSNAIKFTDSGEIRVGAAIGPGDTLIFSVSDTGIGIAPADQGRIFEEFSQVESPAQSRVKGTGLGLPLSRKLAELLGGQISVRSRSGAGSTFYAAIPRVYQAPDEDAAGARPEEGWLLDPALAPVLLVEDDPVDLMLYEKILEGSGFQVLPARTLDEARRVLARVRPVAVLLDIVLEAESGWTLVTELKGREATRTIPILVLTVVDGQERALALGADAFGLKPIDRAWLLEKLAGLASRGPIEAILIIDDSEADRYHLREVLSDLGPYGIIEESGGRSGFRRARQDRPSVIFLDLAMPDATGFEVMEWLKSDAETDDIPIIVVTSQILDDDERRRLSAGSAMIVSKWAGSRVEASGQIREALLKAGLNPVGAGSEP